MSEKKMPMQGNRFVYKDVPFILTSNLVKRYDAIGGGVQFKAECIIEGDDPNEVYEVYWMSIPQYDVVVRKVKARLRTVESLEHADEKTLFEQFGGAEFYHNDAAICNWAEPNNVFKK